MNSDQIKNRRRRLSAIYRKAAAEVESHGDLTMMFTPNACAYGYSCNAIESVQGRDFRGAKESNAVVAFKAAFGPGWANEHGFFGPMESMKNRGRRVVALCFAAAMADTGDL